jgi:hypothetical protein
MNIKMLKTVFALLALTISGVSNATPIALNYEVSDIGGGLLNYEFSLSLDNNDNSWAAGQGWRWFIFGDGGSNLSPLTDFVGDASDLPVGPWSGYTNTSGGYNGPTLNSVLDYWIPVAIGEVLTWSGTSTANLAQGELLFTTLAGTLNGAVAADLDVANRVEPSTDVPEPSTLAIFALGLMVLASRRFMKKS